MRISHTSVVLAFSSLRLIGCHQSDVSDAPAPREVLVPEHIARKYENLSRESDDEGIVTPDYGKAHVKARKHRVRNKIKSSEPRDSMRKPVINSIGSSGSVSVESVPKSRPRSNRRTGKSITSVHIDREVPIMEPSAPARPSVSLSGRYSVITAVSDIDLDLSTVVVRRALVNGVSEQIVAIKYKRDDCVGGGPNELQSEHATLVALTRKGMTELPYPILLGQPFLLAGNQCPVRALVTEYGGVSLRRLIQDEKIVLGFFDIIKITRELAHAVYSIHTAGIAHMNLDWSHVLVRDETFRDIRLTGWRSARFEPTNNDIVFDLHSICYVVLQMQNDVKNLAFTNWKTMDVSKVERCLPMGEFKSLTKKVDSILKSDRPDFARLDSLLGDILRKNTPAGNSFFSNREKVFFGTFTNMEKKLDMLDVLNAQSSVSIPTPTELMPYSNTVLESGGSRMISKKSNEISILVKNLDENYVVKYGSNCMVDSMEGGAINDIREQYIMGKVVSNSIPGDPIIRPLSWLPGDKLNGGFFYGNIKNFKSDMLSDRTPYQCSHKEISAIAIELPSKSAHVLSDIRLSSPLRDAFQIFVKLIDALQWVHKENIVIRNINSNSLLFDTESPRMYFIDLSGASFVTKSKNSYSPSEHELTAQQIIHKYSSPNELENLDRIQNPSTFRDDIYKAFELTVDLMMGKDVFTNGLLSAFREEQRKQLEAIAKAAKLNLPPPGVDHIQILAKVKRDLVDVHIPNMFKTIYPELEDRTTKSVLSTLSSIQKSILTTKDTPKYEALRQMALKHIAYMKP